MKIRLFLFMLSAWVIHNQVLVAQDSTQARDFKMTGSPIVTVFANAHSGIVDNDRTAAFEVARAYLGYKLNFSKGWYSVVKLDIGSPDDLSQFSRIRRYAYFKNAMLGYTWKGLKVEFGLIDMQHFKLQEKFWGYRYIAKSYNDRYRFGTSADLGVDIMYKFTDWFSADVSVTNGEGYSNLQRDNTLKGGMGLYFYPLKGLSLKVYGDIMSKSVDETTLSTFIGYKFKDLARLGVEYNHRFNYNYESGKELYGYSVYGTVILPLNFEIFGRYDWLTSNVPEGDLKPWHLVSDGSSVIAGIQYQPAKFVKIAVDYQDWYARAVNEPDLAFIFLNVEFKY